MLLPYGTDAPVYHFPIATIGIIVINAVMFVATGMGDYVDARGLILEFDQINPLQWLTAAFMHASWIHLIGNMIFLWTLGLVVEGKLGSYRFCWLYIGLALADGAIGQIPMFVFSDREGGALGASGVIFALIAVSVVWAPLNDIHFFYAWTWYLVGTFEIPIYAVALFYAALQFLQLWWVGLQMSTPMLHLLGLTIGFPFAVYMLKHGRVDCEGWDLFTRLGIPLERTKRRSFTAVVGGILQGNPESERTEVLLKPGFGPNLQNEEPDRIESADTPRDPCATAVESFGRAVGAHRISQAMACFERLRSSNWASAVPDATLVAYVHLLTKHAKHCDCLVPLRYLVARRSRHANQACLRIAAIEVKHNDDPESAIRKLQEMSLPMNDRFRRQREQILRIARKRIDAAQNCVNQPASDPAQQAKNRERMPSQRLAAIHNSDK